MVNECIDRLGLVETTKGFRLECTACAVRML